MKAKLDLGVWIAGLGAAVVLAAVIAGFFSISSPGEARALRLDSQRLMTMQRIAASAQCAYTFTNAAPVSVEEIRRDFLEHRVAVAAGDCTSVQFTEAEAETVAYEAASDNSITLCAEFRRPSPQEPAEPMNGYGFSAPVEFPELQQRRAAAGRHCYRIRLVKQVPLSPGPSPSAVERPR